MLSRLNVEHCRCIQLISSFFVIFRVQGLASVEDNEIQEYKSPLSLKGLILLSFQGATSAQNVMALLFHMLRRACSNAESMLFFIPSKEWLINAMVTKRGLNGLKSRCYIFAILKVHNF